MDQPQYYYNNNHYTYFFDWDILALPRQPNHHQQDFQSLNLNT